VTVSRSFPPAGDRGPSHSTAIGNTSSLYPAAWPWGDGIIVESTRAEKALCDGIQSLKPEKFYQLMKS